MATKSLMFAGAVLAVMLSGVASRGIIYEDETIDLTRAANVAAPGILWCDGTKVEYRVADIDLFAIAFVNPAEATGASVERVQIGARNTAECLGTRYPKFGPESLKKSFTTVLNYTQCGFVTFVNPVQQTISYTNEATIVVRLASPAPGIVRRKTFKVGLNCYGSAVGNVSTSTQYFEYVDYLGAVEGQFDLSISAKARQELRPIFGNNLETNVHIITVEIDAPYPERYDIIGHRCWATPEAHSDTLPSYPFILPRGCDRWPGLGDDTADFVQVDTVGKHKYVYNVAEFSFDGIETDVLYFHCEVNVCVKTGQSGNHCTKSCPASRSFRITEDISDFAMSSAAAKVHPTLRPNVAIDANGVPRKQ